jgi:charged multivesicular body protein 2B
MSKINLKFGVNLNCYFRTVALLEQLRENDRNLRKVTRDVERDRRELEREEKKLEMDIKKAAKVGNKQACTVLAKQLVQLRKQKTRTYQVGSKFI